MIGWMALMQSVSLIAQPVGNIRGVVTDGASGQALPYVSVVVLQSNPPVGVITDSAGYFRLNRLPVGRYDIQSSFVGYEPVVLREIMVSSGKEVFLEIAMRENIQSLGEVIIRAKVNKEAPLNTMAMASARMFSVEEASRYAGGLDDPARLVTAFAGVSGGLTNNGIAIRGNSPLFLQWRIEGVEAVNPTHFSDMTGIGGGILTALSSQALGNSDFLTGAFPAEYGNALSGVFDMQLRTGNNQKNEHTAQIGILGVEFGSEGPFAKGKQASYLFNYRYSSMALLNALFPDLLGDAGGMKYQDLSFKMNFPTRRAGTFSLWGVGLANSYVERPREDTAEWEDIFAEHGDFRQTKAVGGVGHRISLNERTFLKSALVANYTKNHTLWDLYYIDESPVNVAEMKNSNQSVAFNTFLNTKFSATHTNRTGIVVTGLFYDLKYDISPSMFDFAVAYPPDEVVNYAAGAGNSVASAVFTQSSFRLSSSLTANVGLHAQYLHLTEKATVEPRIGVRWQVAPKHAFGLAYGKHSRRENIDYYFVNTDQANDRFVNRDLDFAKAHHLVLSYDWSVSEHLRLKVEPYYQYLYDVPVEKDSPTSIINHRDFYRMIHWVNGGKGKNYGMELTLERYLNKGYYYLMTASLFESLYTGGDGVWRNTRLNRNYIINALGGKEWQTGRQKQNIVGVSIRFTLQGSERYTPIDEEASIASKSVVLDDSQIYTKQMSPEFMAHFNVSYTINRNRLSHEFALKMVNVTGAEMFDGYYYNHKEDRPQMWMVAMMMPNVSYRINF